MTTNRLPAEWEPCEAVLLAWPHENTDWAHMLDEVRHTYGEIIKALANITNVIVIGPEAPDSSYYPEGTRLENIIYRYIPTNDTWTRDYGPITVFTPDGARHLDFCFNGWGLKFAAARDNMATARLCEAGLLPYPRLSRLGFTLEGGGIDTDGKGFILTTASCQLNPNRNGEITREEIDEVLKQELGAHTVAWLYNGELEGDDTDGHIDTLARIVPPGDTILFSGCSNPSDSNYPSLLKMKEELQALRRSDGMPFNLVELPIPDPIYDPEDGTRLPATYANFLIVNNHTLLPVYNQPLQDMTAKMALQAAMPDYEIISIDCNSLIRQHGSLHCATMQIPKAQKLS